MNRIYQTLLLATLCTLVGCGSSRRLITTTQQDSVRVEIVERVVEIKDTVRVEIPIETERVIVPADSTSYLENSVAESTASIMNGLLFHSLNTKPITLEKVAEVQTIVRDSIAYKEKIITDYIEVPRELTWGQKTQMKGFWVLLLIIFGYFVIKRL